jgi:hypothetical protein
LDLKLKVNTKKTFTKAVKKYIESDEEIEPTSVFVSTEIKCSNDYLPDPPYYYLSLLRDKLDALSLINFLSL